MACPAAIVSQETRFSLPSRCSTTTSMLSVIRVPSSRFSVPGSQFSVLSSQKNQLLALGSQLLTTPQTSVILSGARIARSGIRAESKDPYPNSTDRTMRKAPFVVVVGHSRSQHPHFILQLLYQLLRHFGRRAFQKLRVL